MAASPPDSSSLSLHDEDLNSSSSTDIEDLIDPSSSKFSPQLALLCASSNVSVPCPDAPRYLNVFELEKAVPDPRKEPIFGSVLEAQKAKIAKLRSQIAEKTKVQKPGNDKDSITDKATPSTSTSASASTSKSVPVQEPQVECKKPDEPFYPMPGRKFLAHQMPVYRPRREHPTVTTEMNTAKGPLAILKKVMTNRQRVKIWTRNNTGIRGFCTAVVQAFDRHWNLILQDVYEIFQRKRPDKSEASRNQTKLDTQPSSSRRRQELKKKTRQSDKTVKSTNECILIEGPDALVTLRLHLGAITQYAGGDCKVVGEKQCSETTTVTKAQLRKKHLSIFPAPRRDTFGFFVLAQSQHYEIVQRRQKQLFLMGNDIAFIEPSLNV